MRHILIYPCVILLAACTATPTTSPLTNPMPTTMPAPALYPAPTENDLTLKDFHFRSGQSLPDGTNLHIHYRTLGTLHQDTTGKTNAILIIHGTTGTGNQFLVPEFAGQLFGPGQPLDAAKYFIILPDALGHGDSSRPSEGLHARFPNYTYQDMIEAEYQLVRGLGINHLRLVMGTSMGGMHTWLWGEDHPDMMDALLPLASVPEQISGRNRVWRRIIMDAIRNDPDWRNGDYTTQPHGLTTALETLFLMSSNPATRHDQAPTLAAADRLLDDYVKEKLESMDANDVLYAVAASQDYDPAPSLAKITAPLLAINSADDLINPADITTLQTNIARVPHGHAITLPETPQTRGHGTHTMAWLWKDYLIDLLQETQR